MSAETALRERMLREVEYIASIHADGHGAWTPKEWRSFVVACDMLNWSWLRAALAATPPAPAGSSSVPDADPVLDVERLARAISRVENRTEMGGGQPGPQTMRHAEAVAAEYARLREHPEGPR